MQEAAWCGGLQEVPSDGHGLQHVACLTDQTRYVGDLLDEMGEGEREVDGNRPTQATHLLGYRHQLWT